MKEEHRERIKELMGQIECPKDFKCAENDFEHLCKARDIGLVDYLECLEDTPQSCLFATPIGDGYFCRCPVRVYLGKELGL